MQPTLQTLIGDLKREQENLDKFTKAQTERIYGLYHATTGKADEILDPQVLANYKLSLHKEGQRLLDETREISARIDNINWKIRATVGLSLQETFDLVKVAKKDITEVL